MEFFGGLLLFAVAAGFLGLFLNLLLGLKGRRQRREAAERPPRLVSRPPLDAPRADLYRRLRAALPDHPILTEIPFERLLAMEAGERHPFAGRRAELLVCDGDLNPKGVVVFGELPEGERLEAMGIARWSVDPAGPPDDEAFRRFVMLLSEQLQ